VEAVDPTLRVALTNLLVAPTVDHHLAVARAYRQLGIMDDAVEYLSRSLVTNGPNAAVYDALARLWRDWGWLELGLADAHRAVYYDPQSAAARNTLGTLLFRLGKRTDAEAEF
jgi:Flp pilus assembly protein TadD